MVLHPAVFYDGLYNRMHLDAALQTAGVLHDLFHHLPHIRLAVDQRLDPLDSLPTVVESPPFIVPGAWGSKPWDLWTGCAILTGNGQGPSAGRGLDGWEGEVGEVGPLCCELAKEHDLLDGPGLQPGLGLAWLHGGGQGLEGLEGLEGQRGLGQGLLLYY
jgi:hypothetical protein